MEISTKRCQMYIMLYVVFDTWISRTETDWENYELCISCVLKSFKMFV